MRLLLALVVLARVNAAAEGLWPDLAQAPKAAGGGENDAAVVVGAEDYAFVPDVPGARKNAEAWHAYLTDTLRVPAERVALLRDHEATLEELRRHAAEKAAEVKEGGTLWFVFVGHGAPSKDGQDGLLVGSDAQQKAESLYARSLSRGELLGLLNKGRQAKTVVLLDACFSGRSGTGEALVAGLQPLIVSRGGARGADARTVMLTAAKADQFAGPLPKAGEPRPAFSYLALGGLRGWAAGPDGKVTAGSLKAFIERALKLAKDRIQTPELAFGKADAVLGTGREPAPDLAKIDREGSEGGFRVTALGSLPKAEAPRALDASSSGLDFRAVDVASLQAYNDAFKVDKSVVEPAQKASVWRHLAQTQPKFRALAEKRAAEWEDFAVKKKAAEEAAAERRAARDGDWDKLSQLLELDVVPAADRARWAAQFANAYKQSPGLTAEMAAALAAGLPKGPARAELEKLAKTAPSASDEPRREARTPGYPQAVDGQACAWLRHAGEGADRAQALAQARKGFSGVLLAERLSEDGPRDGRHRVVLDGCLAKDSRDEQLRPTDFVLVPIKAGDGASPKASDTVRVHYDGKFLDGNVFDSSRKRGQPMEFALGSVVKCWTQGLQRMKVGGKYRLVCPPALAYGETGAGAAVPPNATLAFEVELLGIK